MEDQKSEEKSMVTAASKYVQELILEILAILLPGFVFFTSMVLGLVIPAFFFAKSIDGFLTKKLKFFFSNDKQGHMSGYSYYEYYSDSSDFYTAPPNVGASIADIISSISSFHIETFVAFLGISYVVGAMMFRHDPKHVDEASFFRIHTGMLGRKFQIRRALRRSIGKTTSVPIAIWPKDTHENDVDSLNMGEFKTDILNTSAALSSNYTREKCWVILSRDGIPLRYKNDNEPVRLNFDGMVRPDPDTKFLDKIPVEFPYSHLKNYLKERGFKHLADLIYWPNKNLLLGRRSKYFINTIKINIGFLYSEAFTSLSKAEGHVRLASSCWYAFNYIQVLSLIGAVAAIIGNLAMSFAFLRVEMVYLFSPVCIFIISLFAKDSIERSFHYQRCREIFYILQVYYLASEENDRVKLGVQSPSNAQGAAEDITT